MDFNKTGKPVLDTLPSVDEYPDFMEKFNKSSYRSEKVLGKLYRNIKLDESESGTILKYRKSMIVPNEKFLFKGYKEYIDEAIFCREHYNGEIRSLMKTFRVKNEAEIITAQLLNFKQVGGKSQDLQEGISENVSFIIHDFTVYMQFEL